MFVEKCSTKQFEEKKKTFSPEYFGRHKAVFSYI